jgi:hypothetical protein
MGWAPLLVMGWAPLLVMGWAQQEVGLAALQAMGLWRPGNTLGTTQRDLVVAVKVHVTSLRVYVNMIAQKALAMCKQPHSTTKILSASAAISAGGAASHHAAPPPCGWADIDLGRV